MGSSRGFGRATRRRVLVAGGALLGGGPGAALSATTNATAPGPLPADRRPVTLVVPFTPGAPPDLVARVLAEGLQRRLGRPVVVENRPGASGNIGAALAARAAPDGHTLMVHTTTLVMNVGLYRGLPFDPLASFAPVAALVDVDYALVLHPSGGHDLAEFVARAGAWPEALNYGSPGIGTPHHLTMELFERQSGVRMLHVPYRGTAGAVTGLLSGEVQAMFMPASAALELTRDGSLRAVAAASAARLPLLPAVPTVAEGGIAGVAMRDWFALLAPAGMEPGLLARLNAEANAALAAPEAAALLGGQGYDVVGGTAEELGRRMALDLERWGSLIREANIRAD